MKMCQCKNPRAMDMGANPDPTNYCDHCGFEIPKRRELDEKEKAKGRSSNYWEMDSREQWAEDKRLGILDWDGN